MLSVSLGHGFTQGDVPEQGTRVLVVTDNAKAQGRRARATSSARKSGQKRGTWYPPYLSYDDAHHGSLRRGERPGRRRRPVRQCGRRRGLRQHQHHPPPAGARLHRCGGRPDLGSGRGAVLPRAGVGATFPLRFGGKTSATSGLPIDGDVTVLGLAKDGMQTFGTAMVKFGDGAGIRVGGVDVALIAHRTQALGTEIFTSVGIDLSTKQYVGVKSTNHFHAAYAPIAAKVIYCDGEGPSPLDARKYPYTRSRRTIWPHAELPAGKLVV